MKKFSSIITLLVGLLCLFGCGSEKKNTGSTSAFSRIRYQLVRLALPPQPEREPSKLASGDVKKVETIRAPTLASGGKVATVQPGTVSQPLSAVSPDFPPAGAPSQISNGLANRLPSGSSPSFGSESLTAPSDSGAFPSARNLTWPSPALPSGTQSNSAGTFANSSAAQNSSFSFGGVVPRSLPATGTQVAAAPASAASSGSTSPATSPVSPISTGPAAPVAPTTITPGSSAPSSSTGASPGIGFNPSPASQGSLGQSSGTGGSAAGNSDPVPRIGDAPANPFQPPDPPGKKIPISGDLPETPGQSPEDSSNPPQVQPLTASGGIGGRTGRGLLSGLLSGDGEAIQVAYDGTLGSNPAMEELGNGLDFIFAPLGITFDGYPHAVDLNARVGVKFLPPATVDRMGFEEGDQEPGGVLGSDPNWLKECEGTVVRLIHLGTLPKDREGKVIGYLVSIREGNEEPSKVTYADYRLDSKCRIYPNQFPITYNGVMMYLVVPEGTRVNSELVTVEKTNQRAWSEFLTWVRDYQHYACMRGPFRTTTVLSVEDSRDAILSQPVSHQNPVLPNF